MRETICPHWKYILRFTAVSFAFAAASLTAATTDSQPLFPGATLAPSSTLFYFETPSVTVLSREFLSAHQKEIGSPIVTAATAANLKSPLLNHTNVLASPPLLLDFVGGLYALLPDHLFCAISPAPDKKNLLFLAGGKLTNSDLALEGVKASIAKKMPSLSWKVSNSNGDTLAGTTIPGVGELQLASCKGWLLIATDGPALTEAIATLHKGKSSAATLADSPAWKATLAGQAHQPLFIYFSNISQIPPVADAGGLASQSQWLRTRLSGLEALSWTWNTPSTEPMAYDRFLFILNPSTAATLARLTGPLAAAPNPLPDPDTVYFFTFRSKLADLLQTPAFAALNISEQSKKWFSLLKSDKATNVALIDATLLVDHPESAVHCAWVLRLPLTAKTDAVVASAMADGGKSGNQVVSFKTASDSYLVIADDAASAAYFRSRVEARLQKSAPKTSDAFHSLPSLPNPFLELRMDRARIVGDLIGSLKKNAATALPVLKTRGVMIPDPAPDFQPERWLGPVRASCALRGNNLLLDNYFELRDSRSTGISATTTVGVQAFGPEIMDLTLRWKKLFESADAKDNAADSFTECMISPFLFGPLLTSPTNYMPGVDVLTHYILANPPALKP